MRPGKGTSLKTTVLLPILVVGLLGLAAAIITGSIYRTIILNNTKQNLTSLIELESTNLLDQYKELTETFGISIQKSEKFKNAVKEKRISDIQKLLNDEFHSYYVTTGIVDVQALHVYDTDFNVVASSSEGEAAYLDESPCSSDIEIAKSFTGVDRLKSTSGLCVHEEYTYYSIITPIGTLQPIGFLHIITNPVKLFTQTESDLGMPVKLLDHVLDTRYESPDWPQNINQENILMGVYSIMTSDGVPALTIAIARDISALNNELDATRLRIVLIGSLIALILVLFFLFVIHRTVLKPLAILTRELQDTGQNRKHIGNTVKVKGNFEIRQLADSYNAMSLELSEVYSELEAMAYTDPLTALPNRSLLQRQLLLHSELVKTSQLSFALFMMDLDKFKAVNDTLGHHAGDDLLQQVSQRLSNVLRRSDTLTRIDENAIADIHENNVARLGGDEFAAILPAVATDEDATIVAKKIIAEFQRPFTIEGRDFNVGVSIGISIAPTHGFDPGVLMRHADSAMYIAKNSRVGYCIYDPSNDENNIENLRFATDLSSAIKNNELHLHFQPKYEFKRNQITGCEALIRWRSTDHGDVPADKIIEQAEQSDLIHPLTRWVLEEAIRRCTQWHKEGLNISVSVNLSTKSLQDNSIVTITEELLTRYKLDARHLCLEVTETAIMLDTKRALHILFSLGKLGVRTSIDDFGTGYSSLSYLKKLPVNEIKIDRSFVMDMLKDSNDLVIVNSIIDLAHKMGLAVVAEGVESESILKQLKANGCDQAQGYYISRPIDNDRFVTWLKESNWSVLKS